MMTALDALTRDNRHKKGDDTGRRRDRSGDGAIQGYVCERAETADLRHRAGWSRQPSGSLLRAAGSLLQSLAAHDALTTRLIKPRRRPSVLTKNPSTRVVPDGRGVVPVRGSPRRPAELLHKSHAMIEQPPTPDFPRPPDPIDTPPPDIKPVPPPDIPPIPCSGARATGRTDLAILWVRPAKPGAS
jgi:hypothetical protein